MFQKISTILLWSDDYKRLAAWYQDMFNLRVIEQLDHPNDTGILMEFPGDTHLPAPDRRDGGHGPWLWAGKHSEIQGKNKDPLRIMFNINVDSVSEVFTYLKGKGVTFIAEPFKAPTFDKWFATFSDPDGNTIQIIGKP